jgi:hypothetical protein
MLGESVTCAVSATSQRYQRSVTSSTMPNVESTGDHHNASMPWVTGSRLSRELAARAAAVCRIRAGHPGWQVWVRPGTGAWCAVPPRGYVWEGSTSCLHGWDAESLEVVIAQFERGEVGSR